MAIVDEAKRVDTEMLEEPSAKRVKRDVIPVRLVDIVSFWRDQVKEDIGSESCDETSLGMDDIRKMTAPQIVTAMMETFGPDRWRPRLARIGSRLFFNVLTLAPDKSSLLSWGEEPSEHVVAGLCPARGKTLETVVRPCIDSFVGKLKPTAEQLHALCDWKLYVLEPLTGILMDHGFTFSEAVEALQEEYNTTILKAPHNGTGVPASQRCDFHALKSNQHISQCQDCLEMFHFAKKNITTDSSGLFSLYSRLFNNMGAEHGYSLCAFVLMMMSQLFVGNPLGGSKGPQLMFEGPTSVGKTWTIRKVLEAFPVDKVFGHNSGSLLSTLDGDKIGGFEDCLVRHNFHIIFSNEFTPMAGTLPNEWWGDDKQQHATGRKLSDDGKRQEPVNTLVVKTNTAALASCNTMLTKGEFSPAAAARWISLYSMNPPTFVHRLFPTPESVMLAGCSQTLLRYLLASLSVNSSGLYLLVPGLVPAFPTLISALEILRHPGKGAPALISLRTMESTRIAAISAWQAHCTMHLLLTRDAVSMLDLLIARSVAMPYDWPPFIMQASGTSPTSVELGPPFGRLGASCLMVPNPDSLPRGYARITDVEADNHRKLQDTLSTACIGLVVSRKEAVENMSIMCRTFPGQSDYCCKSSLLTMQPPREATDAVQSIMRILYEMVTQDLLLVDDVKEFAYLPNFLLMWLNGQDVSLVEKLVNQTAFTNLDSTRHLKVHLLTDEEMTDANKIALKNISVYLTRLAKYRQPGFIWALLHCGAEFPHLTGTADYKIDKTLENFILQQQQQPVGPNQPASPRNPTDFVPDGNVLKRPDVSPQRIRPLRVFIQCMTNLPIGVSPLLRAIEKNMRLPGRRIMIPLTNDGVAAIHPEPSNTIAWGDTINSGPGSSSFDLLLHPNKMLFDPVTCFSAADPTKLLEDVLYYMWTLYTWMTCRLELITEASDEILCQVAPNIKTLTVDWKIDEAKELEFLSRGEITTTLRMVMLAMMIHGAKATARFPFAANFVAHLIKQTDHKSENDLIPAIVKFIATKATTGSLVRRGRVIADGIMLAPSPDTFLDSLIFSYPAAVKSKLQPCIAGFYEKLHRDLFWRYSADDFNRFASARNTIIP